MTNPIKKSRDLDPVDLSIRFRGTELLAIQYLLSGKNSQYGFKFELMGLNKANFTGSRNEEMLDTNIVQTAEQTGDLRKVTFYISHEDSPSRTRAVQLNFYEDGHTTSSSEVRPSEFNRFISAIHTTRRFSKYLEPLDDLMEEYLYNVELESEREWMRDQISAEFAELLDAQLGVTEDDVIATYMYKMAISNIGIELYVHAVEEGIDGSRFNVPSEWGGNIHDFFTTYAQYNIEDSGDGDYRYVASKLDHLLRDWSNNTDNDHPRGAVGLLEYYTDDYDLET